MFDRASSDHDLEPGLKQPARIKAFISYARVDIADVQPLIDQLKLHDVAPLVDVDEILPLEEWRKRLQRMIISADAFIFCLSPNSAASDVCRWEADLAEQYGKRIAPIVIKPITEVIVPEVISRKNYILLIGSQASSVKDILVALRTDIDWVRQHTRLGDLAVSWSEARRPRGRLLQGDDISVAEAWQRKDRDPTSPPVTFLQNEFISASRRWSTRRRQLLSGSAVLFAITVALGVVAWTQQTPLRAIKVIGDSGGSVETANGGVLVILPKGATNIRQLIDAMGALAPVTQLDVGGTGIDDRNASALLSRLKSLRKLDLQDNPVTDDGVAHLSALQELEELDLSSTAITDRGLAALVHLPKLRRLVLSHTEVTGSGFLNLPHGSALRDLALDGAPRVDAERLAQSALAQGLEVLSLKEIGLTDEKLPFLAHLRRLRELYLDGNPLQGHTLRSLSELRLAYLGLSRTELDARGFDQIGNLTSLEDVGLKSVKLDDVAFQNVCKLKIKVIRVPDTQVTDKGFECLQDLDGLEEIYFGGTGVTAAGVVGLRHVEQLRALYFPSTAINDDVIDKLVSMKQLRKIWAYNSKMTLSGISRLRSIRPDIQINMSPNIQ